jgi:hypothetical protein
MLLNFIRQNFEYNFSQLCEETRQDPHLGSIHKKMLRGTDEKILGGSQKLKSAK